LIKYLDLEDAIQLVGAVGFFVKDLGLLDSALARPKTSIFGEDAYTTLELKGASLMHSVIKNHPMIDGNKRTAWILMVTFMALNGLDVEMTTETGMMLAIGLATDELTLDQAAELIKNHLVPRS
jgi:death on curing protein